MCRFGLSFGRNNANPLPHVGAFVLISLNWQMWKLIYSWIVLCIQFISHVCFGLLEETEAPRVLNVNFVNTIYFIKFFMASLVIKTYLIYHETGIISKCLFLVKHEANSLLIFSHFNDSFIMTWFDNQTKFWWIFVYIYVLLVTTP